MKGVVADPVRKTYWVYTDQSIYELVAKNEDRDVWKIYLEKGKYDLALQYAKVSSEVPRICFSLRIVPDSEAARLCNGCSSHCFFR